MNSEWFCTIVYLCICEFFCVYIWVLVLMLYLLALFSDRWQPKKKMIYTKCDCDNVHMSPVSIAILVNQHINRSTFRSDIAACFCFFVSVSVIVVVICCCLMMKRVNICVTWLLIKIVCVRVYVLVLNFWTVFALLPDEDLGRMFEWTKPEMKIALVLS